MSKMFMTTTKCSVCGEKLHIKKAKADTYGLELDLEPCHRCMDLCDGLEDTCNSDAEKQEGYVA